MNPINETHPFMVSIWVTPTVETDKPTFFDKPHWMELARCQSDFRARDVAQALAILHKRVQVSRLQGDRFVEVTVLERGWSAQDDIDRSERDRRILAEGGTLDDPTGPAFP